VSTRRGFLIFLPLNFFVDQSFPPSFFSPPFCRPPPFPCTRVKFWLSIVAGIQQPLGLELIVSGNPAICRFSLRSRGTGQRSFKMIRAVVHPLLGSLIFRVLNLWNFTKRCSVSLPTPFCSLFRKPPVSIEEVPTFVHTLSYASLAPVKPKYTIYARSFD